MKILLVAINAKYIHSNLAVYSLRTFAGKYSDQIKIVELSINHTEDEILRTVYKEKAEVVAFSCYIWNIAIVKRITSQLKKVNPSTKIWYGGPECSYDPTQILETSRALDGIMIGEGEQTFLELIQYYVDKNHKLEEICGLAFKESAKSLEESGKEGILTKDEITMTPPRKPLNLNTIPFPYQNMEEFKNRIIYYESSRGCPFTCSYCLSSIEKSVRLRSTELVKQELRRFLDYQIPQVKFVDRTFNCNKQHAMEIWNYIKENDNGITNFHFEIAGDLLTEEEIELLTTLRPGQVQLEIGVQSTNPETVNAIHRSMNLSKLKENVAKIKASGRVHQHLDLIAGLPYENEQAFERSFNEVYRMNPDQLQLGFLKILKGSRMEVESSDFGIVYSENPPYEVLYTKDIDFDTVLRLKGICEMVEIYYNSAQFTNTIRLLEHYYESPMQLYRDLFLYYEKKEIASMSHSRMRRYEILLDFCRECLLSNISEDGDELKLVKELLVYDLYLRENLKSRPLFAPRYMDKGLVQDLMKRYEFDKSLTHIEEFTFDIETSVRLGKPIRRNNLIVFNYKDRNPIDKAAGIRMMTP